MLQLPCLCKRFTVNCAGATKKSMVYFSQETKQAWSASGPQQQLSDTEEEAVDGGALWLPGNTVLELQMLPMVR